MRAGLRSMVVLCAAAAMATASCSSSTGSDAKDTGATSTTAPASTAPSFLEGLPAPKLVDQTCGTDLDLAIKCFWLEVPERRDVPDANTIRLWVGVITPDDAAAGGSPWVYLTGGPGDTNSATWLNGEAEPSGGGPLVIMDQRGTGLSQPRLDCDAAATPADGSLADDEKAAHDSAVATACAKALRANGIDLDGYDTVESAADFVALRELLGYDEWSLYGLSYGGRLAREIARQDPEHVRSLHLDSPASATKAGPAANVARFEQVLGAIDSACADQPACAANGDLLDNIDQAYGRLEAEPYAATLPDGSTLTIDGDELLVGARQLLYDTTLIPVLPTAAKAIAAGDTGLLDQLASQLVQDPDATSRTAWGLAQVMPCADDGGPNPDDEALRADPGKWVGVAGTDTCDIWGVTPVNNGRGLPSTTGEMPTLLTLGEYDPVAPPGTEDEIEAAYPNTTVVVKPGGGHVVAFSDDCLFSISAAFLQDPDTKPDTSCVSDLPHPFSK